MIYVSKEGKWEPPTGSSLGELTDELTLPPLCLEVLKTMPMRQAQTKCKVRGIIFNYRIAQKINFNLMCDMICLEALSDLTCR